MPPKRIVYLFGAGATIAEAAHAGIEQNLSLKEISERVVQKARGETDLEDLLTGTGGNIEDIELYISLLESLGIKKYSSAATKLRDIFCECIQEGLIQAGKPIEPLLAMALLEMHNAPEIQAFEQLNGIITLNYDNLLDRAFNKILGGVNYGIACKCVSGNYNISQKEPPLIKLHGSFNWRTGFPIRIVDGRKAHLRGQKEMIWIPPSIEKEMDRYPFNLLWGRAFELLDCDTLRIVGCSLSRNDWGVLSLLFFSQLGSAPKRSYQIEIINQQKMGNDMRREIGFLRHLKVLGELDGCQEFDNEQLKIPNVFETWLKRKLWLFKNNGIPVDDLKLKFVNELMDW